MTPFLIFSTAAIPLQTLLRNTLGPQNATKNTQITVFKMSHDMGLRKFFKIGLFNCDIYIYGLLLNRSWHVSSYYTIFPRNWSDLEIAQKLDGVGPVKNRPSSERSLWHKNRSKFPACVPKSTCVRKFPVLYKFLECVRKIPACVRKLWSYKNSTLVFYHMTKKIQIV